MYIYYCAHNWDAMLTCIYEAWTSKRGHENIRLVLEEYLQYNIFDEFVHVEADYEKAVKVMDAVNMKISQHMYYELAYSSMSYEEDVLDNIYRVMILGFHYGESALEMFNYRDIIRHSEIVKRVGMEACHFKEFLRFHEISKAVYVAHVEPKSRIVSALGRNFQDRMPSEHWIIVDDTHREAAVHKKDEDFYIKQLSDEEYEKLLLTEENNDEYTDMWKLFFNTIAIKERESLAGQMNHFPLWKRKHAVEFA